MDIRNYFKEQYPMPGLLGVEKLAAVYMALTLLLAALYYPDMEFATKVKVLGGRLAIVAVTFLLWRLYLRKPCHATYQLRVFFQILLLAYWYPDIYNFASMLPNQDNVLASVEQTLFGCQPALEFSQALSGKFWSELMYLGYFFYFLLIGIVVGIVVLRRPRRFDSVTFVVMCTFFMYYVIFLLFNTAGPQFYFGAPGVDAANGVFPFLDDWFRSHSQLATSYSGPFSFLVWLLHGSEAPIAAMPSSHVGVSTVIMLLIFRMRRSWGFILLPGYILLCLSTVYIGAHYAIDVIAGWLTALVFFPVARKLYKSKLFHRPDGFDNLHRFGHHHSHHHHHRRHRRK
ncbi:MAG: phosphatase PAP2 family protein [Bacteroidaceae bacterium]|nr:phosphatase PAP2 family protein [Bacteroidaceae bacterium]